MDQQRCRLAGLRAKDHQSLVILIGRKTNAIRQEAPGKRMAHSVTCHDFGF